MNIIEKATEFSRDFEFNEQNELSALRFNTLISAIEFINEEVRETEEGIYDFDRAEIIDGFGDIAFLALNGIYKEFRTAGDGHDVASAKVNIVMHRICNSNLAKKHADGSIIYDNGKVQKP